MDLRPSRIAEDGDGWIWLAADPRGAQLRLTFWSTVLSVLLIVLAGAATLPPAPVAVPLVAAVLGAGMWLGARLWNRAHSAVAMSPLGVAVRSGFDTAQIAWRALHGVAAEPAGSRVRIVVDAQDTRHRTDATFTRAVAMDWLARCEREAAHRHMHPTSLPDGSGFRTSAAPAVGDGV
jgi:hypothetical protein